MNRDQPLAKINPMTPDQILNVMEWMNKQAMAAHREINDSALIADQMRNSYYEGMRNAFLEAIQGLMTAQQYQCASCGKTGPLDTGHLDKWQGIEQWICPDCINSFHQEATAAEQ